VDSQNEDLGTSSDNPYGKNSPAYVADSPDVIVGEDESSSIDLPTKFTNMVKEVAKLTAEQERLLIYAIRDAILEGLHNELSELELRDQLLSEIGAVDPSNGGVQYGGNPDVYNPKYSIEIDFSDLKYNNFYIWSRVNFVGYYLCDLLSKNSRILYKHTLEYNVDGGHTCKLVIKKSKDAIQFIELPYNTSSKQFYIQEHIGVYEPVSIDGTGGRKQSYIHRVVQDDDSRASSPILNNIDNPATILAESMEKAEELRKAKELKRVLSEVQHYDDNLSEVNTEHTDDIDSKKSDEDHLGGNERSEDDGNSAADSARISEMNLGLPVFKVNDKVEIVLTSELSGDNLEKMDIKNKNKSGIIKEVIDGDRYVVDFDGTEIQLHATELKIYDETVKRVNVRVQRTDVRKMQNAMKGVVEDDTNNAMLSNDAATNTENMELKPYEINKIVRGDGKKEAD
jgi:hypothetical protein